MLIRSDFAKKEVVYPDQYEWVKSPMPRVERMMLDRIGKEVGRATSLVRYAPNSSFPEHVHGGGEELLVLDGEFGDEHGMYSKGTYMRNPIGSLHSPKVGKSGALIFVKLHQFHLQDKNQFTLDTNTEQWQQGMVDGLQVLPLHDFGTEHTALVKWAPFTEFKPHQHWGGEEILVLQGTFYDEHGTYPEGTWIRSPHLSSHQPYTKEDGALIYVKTGHLSD